MENGISQETKALFGWLGTGRLDDRLILAVIQEASKASQPACPIVELQEMLQRIPGPASRTLGTHLKSVRRLEALKCHQAKRAGEAGTGRSKDLLGDLPLDIPAGWRTLSTSLECLKTALGLLPDLLFAESWRERIPKTAAHIHAKFDQAASRAAAAVDPLRAIEALEGREDLAELRPLAAGSKERIQAARGEGARRLEACLAEPALELPADLDEGAAADLVSRSFAAAQEPAAQRRLLDRACAWPTSRMAPVIRQLGQAAQWQERASLLLTLRFGEVTITDWAGWSAWLSRVEAQDRDALGACWDMVGRYPAESLLLWSLARPEASAGLAEPLKDRLAAKGALATPRGFSERYAPMMSAVEWQALGEAPAPPAPVPAAPRGLPKRAPAGAPAQAAEPVRQAQPEEKVPSLWSEHVLPFLNANWSMVAGILMVVAGASVLAYYTWDKHWLIRYTILPALLGGFTAVLALLGARLEGYRAGLKGTADLLRGAAIALLPANFMAVALMVHDPQVTHKALVLPAFALLYFVLCRRGLRSWCSSVDPALDSLLGTPLLLINGLILLGPAAQLAAALGLGSWPVLEGGFYLGFLVMAAAVVGFVSPGASPSLTREERVPWFFGLTLTGTFAQVFLWVHGYTRELPQAHVYAPMLAAAGGLVLLAERRAFEARDKGSEYRKESFIGYALILLGLCMGVSHPASRLITLEAAGAIWLTQAVARRDERHGWIAFTLLMLGGASVACWDSFPGPWIPAWSLALAVGAGACGLLCGRWWSGLAGVGARMQAFLLAATAAAAVLVQWHYRSAPVWTAAVLASAAALFGWRARRDDDVLHVHAAMAILALALPYAGFADMSGGMLKGNDLTFGLALLSLAWLAFSSGRGTRLALGARSGVLLIYGALAVGAMTLRVLFEQGRPGDAEPLAAAMSLGGPVLMAGCLVAAAYLSRSFLPMGLAAVVGVICLPELKMELLKRIPFLTWGSGLASGLFASACVAACFPLRERPSLKDLEGGDLFAGRIPFPWRRKDHTLFTWPLIACAVYLAIKIGTVNLSANWLGMGLRPATAAALVLAGVAWKLLAVYSRGEGPRAGTVAHLGWIFGSAGLVSGYCGLAAQPRWDVALVLEGLYLSLLYAFYHVWLARRMDWAEGLLAAPLRGVLHAFSLLASAAVVGMLLSGGDAATIWPLALLAAAHLAWFGLTDGGAVFGTLLFVQTWTVVAAWTSPGAGPLAERLTIASVAGPTLLYFLSIQALYLCLERAPGVHERLRPLSAPFFFLAALGAFVAGLGACVDAAASQSLSPALQWLLFAVVLATARAQDSGPIAVLGLALGYLGLLAPGFSGLSPAGRLELIASPWRLAAFAAAASGLLRLGELAHERWPRSVEGSLSQGFFRMPAAPWLRACAAAVATFAVLRHSMDPSLRGAGVQLWTPYLAAGSFFLAGLSARRGPWSVLACLSLALGNVHVVRFHLGEALRGAGLMENHLVGLGATATLLQLWLIRAVSPREEVRRFLDRACLAGAGFVLMLLLGTYFVHPGLELITSTRFVVSGLMAWLAGLCFWRAARHPWEGEERHASLWEGLYHLSLVTAIWCFALLFPWFRNPNAALPALGLPVLYFYLRAELASAAAPTTTFRYLNTASALSFFVLALYAFRGSFQALMFPGLPISASHYHFNAPFIMVLALLMLRLHGLGGTSWLAFYGGLALIGGSWFSLTALPGLSPFSHAPASAWCAVALGHFWLLCSSQPSPLKAFTQRLAGIDEPNWLSLRAAWGAWLLVSTQAGVLWGVLGPGSEARIAAPLLLGGATLLSHQAVQRGSPALLLAGIAEAAAALHAGFLADSYLPPGETVWAVLLLWAGLLAVSMVRPRGLLRKVMGPVASSLGLVTLAHVVGHGPGSAEGLGAFAAGVVLLAFTPRASREPLTSGERLEAVVLLAAPTWLVFFGRSLGSAGGPDAVLLAAGAMLLTGAFCRWFQDGMGAACAAWRREEPRLFDQTLSLLVSAGGRFNAVLLPLVFAMAASTQVLHYGRPFAPQDLALVLALYAGSAFAWFREGRGAGSMAPYVLVQLCCLGFFAAVRRQLMLEWGSWDYEYDVWAGLLASLCLSGAKQLLPAREREARIPLLGTLLGMPVLVMAWVLVHGLGSDAVLLVLGLYSLMFAYMGKDDRSSPYHLVSVGGAVAFVLVSFWTKLGLRVAQAYIIPVGLGTLVLLQLFREKISAHVRNEIRAVTLLAMLGSAGYYALLDDRYPAAFHLTLLLLSLLSMGLGSLVRARLYLFLGFAGLVADLLALLCKMLVHMERGARMTLIGGQVLFLGAAMIFGAIYYRTHQEELRETFLRWRQKLSAWE